jgi:hypothetical protein
MRGADDWTDAGFAAHFATLPPDLRKAADENGIDLRHLYNSSPEPGNFADKLRHELGEKGVHVIEEHVARRRHTRPPISYRGGPTGLGGVVGGGT